MQKVGFPLTEGTVFRIPGAVLAETEKHLRAAGLGGKECTVYWGGVGEGNLARIKNVYHPFQSATIVSVDVHPDAVHEMYESLLLRNEILLAQIHTHPGRAFHSGTDDAFPATFLVGFLSIVVPNFCNMGLNEFSGCGVFIHQGQGLWHRMETIEVRQRLVLLEGESA